MHPYPLQTVAPLALFTTVFGGVVFGLALAAPPGPMNAVIAEESAVRGWRAGFAAGLGAMVADLCFLLLALAGVVTVVRDAPAVRRAMVAVGGLLMLYFAYGAVRNATALSSVGATADGGHGFRKAFVLALTNPYQVLFWLTVGVGLLDPGQVDVLAPLPGVGPALSGLFVVQTGHPGLLAGLFGGILVWITGFPATIVAARNRVERLAPGVAWFSAALLAGFGVVFLWQSV